MTEVLTTGVLYDEDFYSWTQQQAALLRQAAALRLNAPDGLDWDNLAEEIDDLGKSKIDQLHSRYVIVLLHLLKWQYQPGNRCSSWQSSIATQRDAIARLMRRNPGMKPKRFLEFEEAYPQARRRAAAETGMREATFPEHCLYTIEQAEDVDFFPAAADEAAD